MSSRSVEMQIAIPRTSEIGSVQNQLMQKPLYDQAALAAKTMQQKQRELQQSTKVDEPQSAQIRENRSDQGKKAKKSPKTTEDDTKANHTAVSYAEHPYKGRHIDLSL
ncbi:MAG: hypothetical protein K0Q59_1096 [Paenibacillus sp.]|jgi:hypothetical protein|nr:hypothetical protein [Paenibacillus sp.]